MNGFNETQILALQELNKRYQADSTQFNEMQISALNELLKRANIQPIEQEKAPYIPRKLTTEYLMEPTATPSIEAMTYPTAELLGIPQTGIGIDEEDASQDPSGSQIYGNIVIGRYAGIRIRNEKNVLGTDVGIYQNIFIDNGYSFYISEPTYWQISLTNNLSVVYDTKYCKHIVCFGDESKWVIGSNHWSSMPQDADWYDVGKDKISDPGLPKDSGWTNLKESSDLHLRDFFPFSSPIVEQTELKKHHAIIFDKVLKRHGRWDIDHQFKMRVVEE